MLAIIRTISLVAEKRGYAPSEISAMIRNSKQEYPENLKGILMHIENSSKKGIPYLVGLYMNNPLISPNRLPKHEMRRVLGLYYAISHDHKPSQIALKALLMTSPYRESITYLMTMPSDDIWYLWFAIGTPSPENFSLPTTGQKEDKTQ